MKWSNTTIMLMLTLLKTYTVIQVVSQLWDLTSFELHDFTQGTMVLCYLAGKQATMWDDLCWYVSSFFLMASWLPPPPSL